MTSLSRLPVQRECERLEGVVTLGAQCCLCGCPEPSQLTIDLIPPLQSDTNGRSHAHVITLSFLSTVSLLCTFLLQDSLASELPLALFPLRSIPGRQGGGGRCWEAGGEARGRGGAACGVSGRSAAGGVARRAPGLTFFCCKKILLIFFTITLPLVLDAKKFSSFFPRHFIFFLKFLYLFFLLFFYNFLFQNFSISLHIFSKKISKKLFIRK